MLKEPLTVIDRLIELFPGTSKQSVQKWLKQGRVLLNDQTIKRKDVIVNEKDEITLSKRKNFDLPFEILYSDSYIVVADKPAGMLSVASLDPAERNVHKYLKRFLNSEKLAPLHRLDKEVAGPLIFVKNQKSFDIFKDLFLNKLIHREYRAIAKGKFLNLSGTFDCYLTEGKGYHVFSTSADKGKRAITHYEVLNQNEETAYLKLTLETGRKNQIRVHLANAGHSILGDLKYGESHLNFKGLALYAHKLEFCHPITKKLMRFESKPPFKFTKLLKSLRLFRNNRISN